MTRTTCLKRMRRLIPAVARREAYVRTLKDGSCEGGYVILSGSGQRGPREFHPLVTARSWPEVLARIERIVRES